MTSIALSRRLRPTPFSDGVEAAGVSAYTIYNRMRLPSVFRSVEEDYRHLKEAVQVWDVACERQVQIKGPDAMRLLRMLTPRDLSDLAPDRCYYIPVVDRAGLMLNDPVVMQVAEETFWISIADTDLLLWVMGLASGLDLNVRVTEPDVAPLAIQGPRSNALAARLFGDAVTELKFFRHGLFSWEGHDYRISRSGFSKQGGFEIYVDGWERGMPLWDALMEAGEDLDVRAGCPNAVERIEAGLLSFGNDIGFETSPFEAGLGKYCGETEDCIGAEALARMRETGPERQIRPVAIEGWLPRCDRAWPVFAGGRRAGEVTSCGWSPDFETNVAIGMIDEAAWDAGTALEVETQDGMSEGVIRERFWL